MLMIVRGWTKAYFAGGGCLRTEFSVLSSPRRIRDIFLTIFRQLVHWSANPTLVLAPAIVAAYVHLARREEARLDVAPIGCSNRLISTPRTARSSQRPFL